MIDLFLAIFFLLFIQLFIGVIIRNISDFNKYGFRYYQYDKTEKNKNWFNHFFKFKPIYKNKALKKLIEENIESYRLNIELKYIMVMVSVEMNIDYFLNWIYLSYVLVS